MDLSISLDTHSRNSSLRCYGETDDSHGNHVHKYTRWKFSFWFVNSKKHYHKWSLSSTGRSRWQPSSEESIDMAYPAQNLTIGEGWISWFLKNAFSQPDLHQSKQKVKQRGEPIQVNKILPCLWKQTKLGSLLNSNLFRRNYLPFFIFLISQLHRFSNKS